METAGDRRGIRQVEGGVEGCETTTASGRGITSQFQLPKWAGSFGFQIIAALIVGLGLGLLAKYTGSTKASPNALGAGRTPPGRGEGLSLRVEARHEKQSPGISRGLLR
ncbi:MAG: hypothetical protein QOH19_1640 [Actinomycetota bacterium]|jgi:hypothetical protein|nr:hypothetical protein [Actinomycetota bacterium]